MKKLTCFLLALVMVLTFVPGAMADDSEISSLGGVSVVMPEIKVELYGTNYQASDIKATLGTDPLTVEDVHVYDKNRDSACIYIVVDISEPMKYFLDPIKTLLTGFMESLGPNEKVILITVDANNVTTVLKGDESLTARKDAVKALQYKPATIANAKFFEALQLVYQTANNDDNKYDRQYVIAFSNGRDGHAGSTTAKEVQELYKTHKLPLYGFLAYNKNNDSSDDLGTVARASGGKCVFVQDWNGYKDLLDDINDVTIVTLRAPNNIADKKTHTLTVQVGNKKLKADVPVEDHIPDTVAPEARAVFNREALTIDVTFSEPVSGAMTNGNYILRNGEGQVLPVTMVEDRENNCYALTVEGLKDGSYTLSFQGISDVSQEANPAKASLSLDIRGVPQDPVVQEGLPMWLIITLGAVALLAVAGVVLAITAHTRKKNAAAAAAAEAAAAAAEAAAAAAAVGAMNPANPEDVYNVQGQVQPEIRYHVLKSEEGKHIRLLIRTGRNSEQTVDTSVVSSLIVGRSEICDVYLDDGMLSRQHFVLENRDGRLFIQDLASKNGTWLNDIRLLDTQELRTGDRIKAGNTLFTITF